MLSIDVQLSWLAPDSAMSDGAPRTAGSKITPPAKEKQSGDLRKVQGEKYVKVETMTKNLSIHHIA